MSLRIIYRDFKELALPALCLLLVSGAGFLYLLPKIKDYSQTREGLIFWIFLFITGAVLGITQGTKTRENTDCFMARLPIKPVDILISRLFPFLGLVLLVEFLTASMLLRYAADLTLLFSGLSQAITGYSIVRVLTRFDMERTITFLLTLGLGFLSLIPAGFLSGGEFASISTEAIPMFLLVSLVWVTVFVKLELKRPHFQ